jgi:hypothetical protein
VEGILSQTHCAAQFNTAQERPPERVAANMDNVESGVLPLDNLPPEARKKTNRSAFPMIGKATILHI